MPEVKRVPDSELPVPSPDNAEDQILYHFRCDEKALAHGNTMPFFHNHPLHEINILIKGSKTVIFDDQTLELKPFDLMILPIYSVHRMVSDSAKPQYRIILYFDAEFFRRYETEIRGADLFRCLQSVRLTIPVSMRIRFLTLLTAIADIYRKNARDYILTGLPLVRTECLMFEFLCMLNEIYDASRKTPYPPVIDEAIRYLETHFHTPLTLDELAEYSGFSPFYFSSLFSRTTGSSFTAYLRRLRITRASELLADTDMPVSEIASACGFSGSNYFRDVFFRETGTSPTEYRNRIRELRDPRL